MTPHEERLVLELHSKWGNRWSKIARKLPGRTDNKIKNYWRTHMRKKAQEKKRASSSSSSLSNSSSSSSICTSNPTIDSMPVIDTKERSFYDTGGIEMAVVKNKNINNTGEGKDGLFSMDEIWKEIDLLGNEGIKPVFDPFCEITPSPIWDYSWMVDGGEEQMCTNMFFATSEQFSARLTG